jgi:flagellar hook assembly protein FlgD
LTWTWPAPLPVGTYTLTYQAQVDSYVQEGTILRNTAQLTYAGYAGAKQASADVEMATTFLVRVGVYNEVGELVKEIWTQQLSSEILSFDLFEQPVINSLHGQVFVLFQGKKIGTWDGTNQAGNPVSNGMYYVKVDNVDPYGVVNTVSQMVTVSRSIAKVQVNVFNSAGEIIRHLYAVVDDPGNLSLADVQLSSSVISPTQDSTAIAGGNNVVSITSVGGSMITWDGKSDSGAIVTNGHYEIEVHYVDGKGGEQVISRGVIVQSSNTPITDGKAFAVPNVLTNGQVSTEIRVNSTLAFTLTASLYDVAGERVTKPVTGPKDARSVFLPDLSALASGLYFVVVDLTDPMGGLAGRQVTQIAIVR